jgi:hypothetical protein
MQLTPLIGKPKPGWTGFSFDGTMLAGLISYGSRWDRREQYPRVAHAFLVIDNDNVIAAEPRGVVVQPLLHYTGNPKCKVYFREPCYLTPEIAQRIVTLAKSRIGAPYDYGLFLREVVEDTLIGHLFARFAGGVHFLAHIFDNPNDFICSEFVAHVYDQMPEIADKWLLYNPLNRCGPQVLFQDEGVYTYSIYE